MKERSSLLRRSIREIRSLVMARLMLVRRKMILWFSRNIRTCCPRRRSAIRPSGIRNLLFQRSTSRWGMDSLSSKRHSMTRQGKSSRKIKPKIRMIKAQEILMTIWSHFWRREDSMQTTPWTLMSWLSRSRQTSWRRWRRGSSRGQRSSRRGCRSNRVSWRCLRSNTRRSRRRRTRRS